MDNKTCVKEIRSYIFNFCGKPEHWNRRYFNKMSHYSWIANEICKTLLECPEIEYQIIFEEYICKLDYFSTLNEDSKDIFEDARDALYEIRKVIETKGDY